MKNRLTNLLMAGAIALAMVGCSSSSDGEEIQPTPPEEMGNTVTDPEMREQFRNGGGNAGQGNQGQGLGTQAPGG